MQQVFNLRTQSGEPSRLKVERLLKKAQKYPEQMTLSDWNTLRRVIEITRAMEAAMKKAEEVTDEKAMTTN